MTRILVFYTSNKRSNVLETEILGIHQRGVEIELLTTGERGALHEFLESQGIQTHNYSIPKRPAPVYYLRQVVFLARFCRRNSVTAVFSNAQHANFIAVFAQYLSRARFVIFRHHSVSEAGDQIPMTLNRRERMFDRVINLLARRIVVPSSGVYEGMRAVEHADMRRVKILPYVYDFDRYGQPDPEAVRSIRSRYPARLTLIMSSRMVALKRHALVFPVVRDLIEEGLDLRMFVLDDGPERDSLEDFIRRHALADRIVMLGFRTDFLDYMAASDLLVHPSLTEASSNVVKEIALLGKTVIACEGVGDFDDYLADGRNAFLVPKATDGSEIAAVLRQIYAAPERLEALGESLRTTVLERFGVSPESVDHYLALAETDDHGR